MVGYQFDDFYQIFTFRKWLEITISIHKKYGCGCLEFQEGMFFKRLSKNLDESKALQKGKWLGFGNHQTPKQL